MPIGCMKGTWLAPWIVAGLVLGGVVGVVAIWVFPWLIIPLIGWRLWLAARGHARD